MAVFQSAGTVLVFKDNWKVAATTDAILFDTPFKSIDLMASEQADLDGSKTAKDGVDQ